MRISVLIVMVLAFLVGGGSSGFLKANLDSRTEGIDYEQLETVKEQVEALKKDGIDLSTVQDPEMKKAIQLLERTPSKSSASAAGMLGMLVALVSLVMIVLAFMKKEKVKLTALLVPVLAAILWLLTPRIEATMTSGADPKSIALIAFIGLAISAACAFVSYNMHLKNVETT